MTGQEALKEWKHWKETNNENGVVWLPLFVVAEVEKSLKALEIIKKTKNIKVSFYENGSGKHYKIEFDKTRNQTITE